MKSIRGNPLALARFGRFDVIVHDCNCRHAMDAGTVKQIEDSFPKAWAADLATPAGVEKLERINTVGIDCGGHRLTVVNAYTQDDWQGDDALLDYDALYRAIHEAKRRFDGKRIAYSKVGAGLARGDRSRITTIVDREPAGETHTLMGYGDADTEAI